MKKHKKNLSCQRTKDSDSMSFCQEIFMCVNFSFYIDLGKTHKQSLSSINLNSQKGISLDRC
jgi:hypothetical protein